MKKLSADPTPRMVPRDRANAAPGVATTTPVRETAAPPVDKKPQPAQTGFDGTVKGTGERRGPRAEAGAKSASAAGFERLFAKARRVLSVAVLGSVLGFGLVGCGAPVQPSPIAARLSAMQQVGSSAAVKAKAEALAQAVPTGIGAPRETAIRKLMDLERTAVDMKTKDDALLGEAAGVIQALDGKVPWYEAHGIAWISGGPSVEKRQLDAGEPDLAQMKKLDADVATLPAFVHGLARAQVQSLLQAERPAFNDLVGRAGVIRTKLEVTQELHQLATTTRDELKSVETNILLRNLQDEYVDTPHSETTDHYDSSGVNHPTTKTWTTHDRNPDWDMFNNLALISKGHAEGSIRALNQAIHDAQRTIPDLKVGSVDAKLIGFFDFFGQPSFGLWSYDSFKVADAREKAAEAVGATQTMVSTFQAQLAPLDAEIKTTVDARYAEIERGRPAEGTM